MILLQLTNPNYGLVRFINKVPFDPSVLLQIPGTHEVNEFFMEGTVTTTHVLSGRCIMIVYIVYMNNRCKLSLIPRPNFSHMQRTDVTDAPKISIAGVVVCMR